jgi:hypothetical protein
MQAEHKLNQITVKVTRIVNQAVIAPIALTCESHALQVS